MILVTGGAGYIGSVLVRELVERGHAVRVFDKLLFGESGLAPVRERIELVAGDLRSFDKAVLDGVKAVVHLAGLSNDPMAEFNPRANHEINADGTARVAEAARSAGIRRFVHASSCSIYDLGLGTEERLCDEDSEVKPSAAYAVSKHDAERILLDLAGPEFCPVLLRKGTVYGFSPRMRYDLVVNTFVKDALTRGKLTVHCGGEMWRPLVDVQDVARAYIAALEADEEAVRGEVFNVVEKNYRVLDLAHRVKESLRDLVEVEVEVDDTRGAARSYRVSGHKAELRLGFRATTGVKESAREMVRLVREHGFTDFEHPRYYNIAWLQALLAMESVLARTGGRLL